jgi:thiol-disulfide isomerase/thioredoxin
MSKYIHTFIILTALFQGFLVRAQNYEIKVQINGLSDTSIILGHYVNKSMYPDDTVRLNHNGIGVFQGDKKLPGGMYLIFLPSQNYFTFLLDEDQQFSIETDTSDLFANLTFKESKLNIRFVEYQKYIGEMGRQASNLREKLKNAQNDAEKEKFQEQLNRINTDVQKYMKKMVAENENNFLGVFIKATMKVEVPESPKDENGNIIDSAFQYKYYRTHYFDNFDVSDPRLLRTPLYQEKIIPYIDKVVPQIPDSIIAEVDWLIEKSRSSDELFQYMLVTLFNHYAKSKIMGMDKVYAHIAEKYYIPEATWSEPKFIEDLKERVAKVKPTLIGNVAENVEMVHVPSDHFIKAQNDTALKKYPYVGSFFNIHDLPADYTVLLFWESDCGHCKTVVPKLHKEYSQLKEKGVEVVAVHMLGGEEGKEQWVEFVNKHQLYDWINAWNPYDYKYKILYDIYSTPVVYLLDKNKKIIAKRVGIDQLKEIIEMRHKHQNKDTVNAEKQTN